MQAPLAVCHERAGSYNRLLDVPYVSVHKMQYLLIHASVESKSEFESTKDTP